MELVDGPDLAQRIAQGPIPVDEAVAIARQIADAMEAAHEQGIVHRDLKPANVKVRDDGTVKVLDFGLAKAFEGSGPTSTAAPLSLSPTFASPAVTGMGMVIGTAAYMSPEQAKGKAVDKRADIWAFGVVLYEMLTGRALFEGETVSEVLASVIMREPDLTALPSSVPAPVRHVIARCLVRDPKLRLRDIGEARLALAGSAPMAAPDVNARREPSRDFRSQTLAHRSPAGLALALVATGAMLWRVATTPSDAPCHSLRRAAAGQDIARARGKAQRRVVAGRIDDGVRRVHRGRLATLHPIARRHHAARAAGNRGRLQSGLLARRQGDRVLRRRTAQENHARWRGDDGDRSRRRW